jgi:hypothetical protein
LIKKTTISFKAAVFTILKLQREGNRKEQRRRRGHDFKDKQA